MPRLRSEKCSVSWEDRYGTTQSGNLPQYRTNENPCGVVMSGITMPGVSISDFHYHHIKCPYSTQADIHYVRDNDPFSPTYGQILTLSGGALTDHATTSGLMIKHNRGSKYGWLCVDDNCYYYTTLDVGGRYFYS